MIMSSNSGPQATLREIVRKTDVIRNIPLPSLQHIKSLSDAEKEDLVSRIHVISSELQQIQTSLSDELKFHVMKPNLVPANPSHILEFLSTKKDSLQESNDLLYEKKAQELLTQTSNSNQSKIPLSHDYKVACSNMVQAYSAMATTIVKEIEQKCKR